MRFSLILTATGGWSPHWSGVDGPASPEWGRDAGSAWIRSCRMRGADVTRSPIILPDRRVPLQSEARIVGLVLTDLEGFGWLEQPASL
jgi:hypothetical protein